MSSYFYVRWAGSQEYQRDKINKTRHFKFRSKVQTPSQQVHSKIVRRPHKHSKEIQQTSLSRTAGAVLRCADRRGPVGD